MVSRHIREHAIDQHAIDQHHKMIRGSMASSRTTSIGKRQRNDKES
jgi:hypothetical protein